MIIFRDIPLDDGELACAHCCAVSAPEMRTTDEALADIGEAVSSWSCGLGPNLAFCGCDPGAHPDVLDLVRTAVSQGVQRVRLDLGEGAIDSLEEAASLIDAGVRNLRVTLLGGIDASHDHKAGSSGHFASTESSIALFKQAAEDAGVHVALSGIVPLCGHNVAELPGIVAKLAEIGATRGLIRLVDGDVDLTGIGPWVVAAFDTGTVNRIWVEAEGLPFFVAPGHEIHLSNTVREFPGVKTAVCEECEAEPWCDGVTPNASPKMLAELVRRADHPALADKLRRARGEVTA